MDDSEKEALAAVLSRMSDEQLALIASKTTAHLRDLQEKNNKYPETQKFLHSKGLTDVKQLDKAGRAELYQYLDNILKLLRN